MQQKENRVWSLAERIIFRYCFIFILLSMLSLPFPYQLLPDIGTMISPVSESLIDAMNRHLLKLVKPFPLQITSDSTSMYIHLLNLLIVSVIATIIWSLADKKRHHYEQLKSIFITLISYFLALQMLIYGFSKLFKWQFYIPEPNTLFTTLGNTPKDLLFWSTMGMSRSYVMFMGIIEVFGAVLLFWRRTRAVGGFILVGIMLNVVMVNFGFDISVKCFSLFLLLLAFIISWPVFRLLILFFIKGRVAQPDSKTWDHWKTKRPWVHRTVKALIVVLFFAESLFMYVKARNFNDDIAPRPYLHGAWNVISFVKNKDISASPPYIWRRVFVHRQGYFIIQKANDRMIDYKLDIDSSAHLFRLQNYETKDRYTLQYRNTKDTLYLSGVLGRDTVELAAKFILLDSLPVMEKGFHWMMEE